MVHSDGGRLDPAREPSALRVDHVALTARQGVLRHRRQIFDGLSFTVEPGEAVGLLLADGSGKTGLTRLAAGLLRPDSGSVSVFGLNPADHPARLRGRVAAVTRTHSPLLPGSTLTDALTLLGEHVGLSEDDSAQRLGELAERLALTQALGTTVGRLTSDQRCRAELAAALLPDPDLLILDDPARGTDTAGRERIRSVLRQENRMRHRSVLMATGDLADVESVCPRLLVGVDGRIRFDGNLDGLTELLGVERVLVVDLTAPTDLLDDLPGTHLIAVEANGLRRRIGIRPGRTTTAKVLADVVSRASVRNLTVQEPDLTDLVRRLPL